MNVLDRNDSPPVFRDKPISLSVSEELGPGHQIGVIKAIDPDTVGELTYSLVDGGDKKFHLDKNSGALKLIDTLDRETKGLYELMIRVSDGIQDSDTKISVQVRKTVVKLHSLNKLIAYISHTNIFW